MNEEEAYNFGRDAGINGANTTNSNFSIFAKPELTKAWVKGRDKRIK